MINNISSYDQHIIITGGYTNPPYVNMYTTASAPCLGHIRINNGNYETYDGVAWQNIGTQPVTIGLTLAASSAITWAIKKQAEEQEINQLCNQYPELQTARDQYEAIAALLKKTELQKAAYEQKIATANALNAKVAEDINKLTAERDEIKTKLNTWTILSHE